MTCLHKFTLKLSSLVSDDVLMLLESFSQSRCGNRITVKYEKRPSGLSKMLRHFELINFFICIANLLLESFAESHHFPLILQDLVMFRYFPYVVFIAGVKTQCFLDVK